jgi:low temperature requirement protein LtrA
VGSARHFVERHGLVLIIALGETLLSTGAGIGTSPPRVSTLLVASLGFIIAVSLWWSYFGSLSGAAERLMVRAASSRRAVLARDGFTLGHFPLIAGVVLVAAGITLILETVVDDTARRASTVAAVALAGGIALYLVGVALFSRTQLGVWSRSSLIGAGAALVIPIATATLPAWCTLALATLITLASSLRRRGVSGGSPVADTGARNEAPEGRS